MSTTEEKEIPPAPVRYAGILGMLEGLVGIIYAIAQVIHQATHGPVSDLVVENGGSASFIQGGLGYANAIFLIIIFGAVGLGGLFLFRGKRWGRGPVFCANLFAFVLAYFLYGAGQYIIMVIAIIVGLIGLGFLLNKQAVSWAAARYAER
ncbi:MAG: hypothetical protein Q3962_02275 [Corynebacterium sp.]|nr:hypothetical protein [Corynebacterium sp.]